MNFNSYNQIFKLIILSGSVILALPIDEIQSNFALLQDDYGKFRIADLQSDIRDSDDQLKRFEPFEDVIFQVYTRLNPNQGQIIRINDAESLEASNFNADHPTRIVIHGWNGDGNTLVGARISYLNRGEFNVIMVDWGVGAQLDYVRSRENIMPTGEVTGAFIDFLVEAGNIEISTVTVIGHSLGAHAAGATGKYTKSGKIPYIIGLDPARPLFALDRPEERIAITDADYVETIHTNIRYWGFEKPLGHASFYPTYGDNQPGCNDDGCNHVRALLFHMESIGSTLGFWANQCANGYLDILLQDCQRTGVVQVMGGEPPNVSFHTGVFHLNVNAEPPYARGFGDL